MSFPDKRGRLREIFGVRSHANNLSGLCEWTTDWTEFEGP